jgi:hypothetical protein
MLSAIEKKRLNSTRQALLSVSPGLVRREEAMEKPETKEKGSGLLEKKEALETVDTAVSDAGFDSRVHRVQCLIKNDRYRMKGWSALGPLKGEPFQHIHSVAAAINLALVAISTLPRMISSRPRSSRLR